VPQHAKRFHVLAITTVVYRRDMDQKVIVITGASGGIGAALAKELSEKNHLLVLAARRERELADVAKASKTRAIIAVADVTRRADVERIKADALREFGRVDVWVSNAGRGISRPVLELTDDDVDQMITINVKSVLYAMQTIVPHFTLRGSGQIVNVSSYLGRVPVASIRSAYSAAKAAMNSLTTNVRMDLRAKFPNIHVTLVMPGMVLTEFGKNALGTPGGPPPQNISPAFKPQTAEEVAKAIAGAIENPVPEIYTNPVHVESVKAFYADPGSFQGFPASR